MRQTGVYKILNVVTNKVYIGSAAKSFNARFDSHRHGLRNKIHHNKHLQSAWNKYGEMNFEFIIIKRCVPQRCIELEQFYINQYTAYNREYGYNKSPTDGSPLGVKWSEKSRKTMSLARTGLKQSKQHRLSISLALKGRKLSVEHTAKIKKALNDPELSRHMSKFRTGRRHNAETLKKMSLAQKGRTDLADRARHMASLNVGRKLCEEHKRKISVGNKGKTISIEQRRKLALAQTGKTYSIESKEKMSRSAKLVWTKRKEGYANRAKI